MISNNPPRFCDRRRRTIVDDQPPHHAGHVTHESRVIDEDRPFPARDRDVGLVQQRRHAETAVGSPRRFNSRRARRWSSGYKLSKSASATTPSAGAAPGASNVASIITSHRLDPVDRGRALFLTERGGVAGEPLAAIALRYRRSELPCTQDRKLRGKDDMAPAVLVRGRSQPVALPPSRR